MSDHDDNDDEQPRRPRRQVAKRPAGFTGFNAARFESPLLKMFEKPAYLKMFESPVNKMFDPSKTIVGALAGFNKQSGLAALAMPKVVDPDLFNFGLAGAAGRNAITMTQAQNDVLGVARSLAGFSKQHQSAIAALTTGPALKLDTSRLIVGLDSKTIFNQYAGLAATSTLPRNLDLTAGALASLRASMGATSIERSLSVLARTGLAAQMQGAGLHKALASSLGVAMAPRLRDVDLRRKPIVLSADVQEVVTPADIREAFEGDAATQLPLLICRLTVALENWKPAEKNRLATAADVATIAGFLIAAYMAYYAISHQQPQVVNHYNTTIIDQAPTNGRGEATAPSGETPRAQPEEGRAR